MKIPPPPRGLPRRVRTTWVIVAAAISAVVTIASPSCPHRDAAGRPLWRVQTVHDGDTVTCLDEQGRAVKIRLVGIDAPEHGQPHGDAARATLAAKIGPAVRVTGDAHDQHGRLLGVLWAGDTNVNRALVAEGLAWSFGGFRPDEEIEAAEADARRARRGLWADPQPVRPAEWRRLHPPHAQPPHGQPWSAFQ
jgi:endonuclease YncB( thermonuclease family)